MTVLVSCCALESVKLPGEVCCERDGGEKSKDGGARGGYGARYRFAGSDQRSEEEISPARSVGEPQTRACVLPRELGCSEQGATGGVSGRTGPALRAEGGHRYDLHRLHHEYHRVGARDRSVRVPDVQ